MPFRPSVRMEQLGFHWMDFHEIWYLGLFRKYVEKILDLLKSDKNNVSSTWKRFHIYDYTADFFLEWEMFQIKVIEKIEAHILCSVTFFPEVVPVVS